MAGGTQVQTLQRTAKSGTGAASSSYSTPLGLGSGSSPLMPALAPRAGQPSLRRQATMAKWGKKRKKRGDVTTNALPFLDLAVAAALNSMDVVVNDIADQVVFQATMQVPVHHVMACRIEAYNTPFAEAPSIRAENLTEEDKQFAACLAAPPDLEEMPSMGLQRLASLLEARPMATQTQAAANTAAAARGGSGGAAAQQEAVFKMSVSMRADRTGSNTFGDEDDDDDASKARNNLLSGSGSLGADGLGRVGSGVPSGVAALPAVAKAEEAAAARTGGDDTEAVRDRIGRAATLSMLLPRVQSLAPQPSFAADRGMAPEASHGSFTRHSRRPAVAPIAETAEAGAPVADVADAVVGTSSAAARGAAAAGLVGSAALTMSDAWNAFASPRAELRRRLLARGAVFPSEDDAAADEAPAPAPFASAAVAASAAAAADDGAAAATPFGAPPAQQEPLPSTGCTEGSASSIPWEEVVPPEPPHAAVQEEERSAPPPRRVRRSSLSIVRIDQRSQELTVMLEAQCQRTTGDVGKGLSMLLGVGAVLGRVLEGGRTAPAKELMATHVRSLTGRKPGLSVERSSSYRDQVGI